jgi:hypothetical protein
MVFRRLAVGLLLVQAVVSCAPAARSEPFQTPTPSPLVVSVGGDNLLSLAELPRGWMLTRETIFDADEYADDPSELLRLEARGFTWHHRRDFENRYGGAARTVTIGVSQYFAPNDATAAVLERMNSALEWAAHWNESAHAVALDVPGAEDLHVIVVDRATQERIYIAYFRVASRQAGVQVGGYPDTLETDFVLHILSEQVRKLRS